MLVFNNPCEYNVRQLAKYILPKILAVDLGTTKHGLATSCERLVFSYPFAVVKNYQQIFDAFQSQNCKTLVVGYPFTNDYSSPEYKICKLVDAFVGEFVAKFATTAVFYVDENFSSSAVRKSIGKTKQNIDSAAAAYFLSEFLSTLGKN